MESAQAQPSSENNDEQPLEFNETEASISPIEALGLDATHDGDDYHSHNPDGTCDNLDEVIPPHTPHALPVVGLGGSAGAIPVLREFFSLMPADSGFAFVVVIHLMPDMESTLPEILRAVTSMPVIAVNAPERLEANRIYVIPPSVHLSMLDGQIVPQPLIPERGRRVAVDLFFRTLADVHGTNATGIILSGADSDGMIGLKRIKERGGLSIAQDPGEAQHDAMPRAAIATGMVDWVLPVREMPTRLQAHLRNEELLRLPKEQLSSAAVAEEKKGTEQKSALQEQTQQEIRTRDENALREVLAFLRTRTGHDFAHYKRATILRRIGRRLQVNSLPDIPSYVEYLRGHPGEAGALLNDLLISVTNFFRDPESFHALEAEIPRIFSGKQRSDQVRVWVAGCATGEEAYSVAILLSEYADKLDSPPSLLVFATDLSDSAIHTAREGRYPLTIEADVSPERLRRFFTTDGNSYFVRRELRELVLFASHNLLRDSPFSKLDLVTCRNLLIYLNRNAQQRAFETFHFALKPEGVLFLGTSESADDVSQLFELHDKKHRLYLRRTTASTTVPPMPLPGNRLSVPLALPVARSGKMPATTAVNDEVPSIPADITMQRRRTTSFSDLHLALLEKLAPPSIVINEEYEIVHLSESAGRFLQFAGGQPSTNLLRVVHPMLRLELGTALFSATQRGEDVRISGLPYDEAGERKYVDLAIRPMPDAGGAGRGLIVVLFETTGQPEGAPSEPRTEPIARQLDEELQQLKASLRATVEQYEVSVEELKASNEELQAMNEEARSTSEELETSKEELQSVNEELTTVNQELRSKVEDLSRANSDLQNLITSTDLATIFLDRELRIKRFTPRASRLFNVIPTDLDRPLAHLTHKLEYPDLAADAEQVLSRLTPIEKEVRSADGEWYAARVLPYRTGDDRIDGVVLTLAETTQRKRAEEAHREGEQRLAAIFTQAAVGLSEISLDGRFVRVNDELCNILGRSHDELLTLGIADVTHPDDIAPSFAKIRELIEHGKPVSLDKRYLRPDGTIIHANSAVTLLVKENGEPESILVVTVDFTERKLSEESLRESEERFRLLVEETEDYAMFLMDKERHIIHWNSGAERVFGWSRDEAIGQPADIIFTPEDREAGQPEREAQVAMKEGRAIDRRWHIRKDGSRFWADGVMSCLPGEGKQLRGFVKIARDMTRQRENEEALQNAHDEMEARVIERTLELGELNSELRRHAEHLQHNEAERQLLLQRIVMAQEEERKRISRELHDQMGQSLTALKVGLSNIVTSDVEGSAERLQILNQSIDDLTQQIHNLAWELRPAVLDNLGLETAVQQVVTNWSKQSGITADFASRGFNRSQRLLPHIESAFYRMIQEALTNIQKHADATVVSVVLERVGDEVRAIIEDNGKGFSANKSDTAHPATQRLGLIGMRERMDIIGGSFSIESEPGKGTTVYARAPFEQQQD